MGTLQWYKLGLADGGSISASSDRLPSDCTPAHKLAAMMKLMMLACLAVAALARPDRDSTLFRQQLSEFNYSPPGQSSARSPLRSAAERPAGFPFTENRGTDNLHAQRAGYRETQSLGSAPQRLADDRDRHAQITSFQNEQTASGAAHSFSATNGLQREETIELRTVYSEDEYGQRTAVQIPIVTGFYQYMQPDGTIVTRSYGTDEEGRLHIDGDDLPKAPVALQASSLAYQ